MNVAQVKQITLNSNSRYATPPFGLTQVTKAVQEYLIGIPVELERIERNKDNLNMAPAMDFVQRNHNGYQSGIDTLMTQNGLDGTQFAEAICIDGYNDYINPNNQLTPKECKELLARMPKSLRELSHLKKVSYDYNGAGYRIHVPIFKPDGMFARIAHAVRVEDFPRKEGQAYRVFGYIKKEDGWHYEESEQLSTESDHPSRLLVGISNGNTIFPSALPDSLGSKEAIKAYQTSVFLHEFFHTIDYPNRTIEARSAIRLRTQDGNEFTFQDWWEEWEDLLIQEGGSNKISYYAGTYSHLLNTDSRKNSPADFTSAVAEQIAESFVAYMLNIQANPDGWTDFSKTPGQQGKYELMEQLCKATVFQKS